MLLKDIAPTQSCFYLKHPVTLDPICDNNKVEVYWDVVGHDSDQYLTAQQNFLQHLEKLGDDASKLSPLDYKAQAATQLAELVIGWDEKFNDFHGGAYTKKKVLKLLQSADHKWIVTQLDSFVASRKNFFQV